MPPEIKVVERPKKPTRRGREIGSRTRAVLDTVTTGQAIECVTRRDTWTLRNQVNHYLDRHPELGVIVRVSDRYLWCEPKGDDDAA